MYNDEQNLYHYTYRKDGSESGQQNAGPAGDGAVGTVQSEPQRPIQEMKPVKKNRMGLKVTALALCCALLGGALGGGIVWGVSRATSEATVQVSDRTVSQVSLKTVDGKTEMTDAEVYAANVNSVVSINVTVITFSASQYRPLRPAPDLSSQQMVISSPTIMWWKMQRP